MAPRGDESNETKWQTPPDLVVKFQPIDIVGFILCWSCSHASCINGKSGAELPSTSEDSCPPLNPMERENPCCCQPLREVVAGELCPLIGVNWLRVLSIDRTS